MINLNPQHFPDAHTELSAAFMQAVDIHLLLRTDTFRSDKTRLWIRKRDDSFMQRIPLWTRANADLDPAKFDLDVFLRNESRVLTFSLRGK